MKTKRNKRVLQKRTTRGVSSSHTRQPFMAHVFELRRRVMWVALSITLGATAAYSVQQHIVSILLKPAGNQQFIYTSPGGGLNFLVQICIYSGVLVSIPVIVYNVLKFIEPVMPRSSTSYIMRGSLVAGVLAVAGVVFGYVYGLPSALKFLAHQFTTDQIKALIAVQSYMHFVSMFLASALIFQAPLIMLLINRIKPLKPGKMLRLKSQRWVILVSFILGAVISPTPDIRSMMILSVPMILSFDIGIGAVWYVNGRNRKPQKVLQLIEQDLAVQAERWQHLQSAFVMQFEPLQPEPVLVSADPAPTEGPAYPNPEQNEYVEQLAVVDTPEPAPEPSGGRTNYRFAVPAQRVRRRIIM
jgi:sec-independent protein translocase protein TatC